MAAGRQESKQWALRQEQKARRWYHQQHVESKKQTVSETRLVTLMLPPTRL